jgi:hypothetical protein
MIHVGHKYKAPAIDAPLIAVGQKHGMWRMREIDGEWLGASHFVFGDDVEPLPMKYFQGQTPE